MRRLAALAVLAASCAWGQCVMCFRNAESQNAARARVLNTGILLLGAPPFLLLAGFCLLAWKRNSAYRDDDTLTPPRTSAPDPELREAPPSR